MKLEFLFTMIFVFLILSLIISNIQTEERGEEMDSKKYYYESMYNDDPRAATFYNLLHEGLKKRLEFDYRLSDLALHRTTNYQNIMLRYADEFICIIPCAEDPEKEFKTIMKTFEDIEILASSKFISKIGIATKVLNEYEVLYVIEFD